MKFSADQSLSIMEPEQKVVVAGDFRVKVKMRPQNLSFHFWLNTDWLLKFRGSISDLLIQNLDPIESFDAERADDVEFYAPIEMLGELKEVDLSKIGPRKAAEAAKVQACPQLVREQLAAQLRSESSDYSQKPSLATCFKSMDDTKRQLVRQFRDRIDPILQARRVHRARATLAKEHLDKFKGDSKVSVTLTLKNRPKRKRSSSRHSRTGKT